MQVFTPPVRWVNNSHLQEKPYRFYRHQVSMSVVYRNSTFQEVRVANPDETNDLVEGETWFSGGRSYIVSEETAALLAGDGFTTTPVPQFGIG